MGNIHKDIGTYRTSYRIKSALSYFQQTITIYREIIYFVGRYHFTFATVAQFIYKNYVYFFIQQGMVHNNTESN